MLGLIGLVFGGLFLVYVVSWLVNTIQKIRKLGDAADKLAGPDKHWLYGNIHQFPGINKMLQYNTDCATKYVTSYRTWFGPHFPLVHLCHPETIKTVMRGSEPKLRFMIGGGGYDLMLPWLGEGLIVSEGERWFRNRRLLTPAFHFDVLKKYILVHNKCADSFLKCVHSKIDGHNDYVEIDKMTSRATFDDVLKCAFSFDEEVQTQGNSSDFPNDIQRVVRLLTERWIKPWCYNDLVYRMTEDGRRFFEKCKAVHKFADEVIARRKRQMEVVGLKNTKIMDFLDILLVARDDDGTGLSTSEIRNEVNTFLFAGHDTTSSALTWALHNMAAHPVIQEKARKEINGIFSGRNLDDVEWNDIMKFEYLTRCIKETLRLHDPVPYIQRRLTKETTIDGVVLPPDTMLEIDIYAMHHNPHVWDSPMKYDPDRFKEPLDDPFKFVPFSGGSRNCIGQNFALNVLHVMLAKTLHRYRLTLDPDHEVCVTTDVVLRSTNGIRIKFEPI